MITTTTNEGSSVFKFNGSLFVEDILSLDIEIKIIATRYWKENKDSWLCSLYEFLKDKQLKKSIKLLKEQKRHGSYYYDDILYINNKL